MKKQRNDSVTFRVNEETKRKAEEKALKKGLTLSKYIVYLLEKDLCAKRKASR